METAFAVPGLQNRGTGGTLSWVGKCGPGPPAKFRDECLNENWFVSPAEARQIIEQWRRHYNQGRPHSPLGYRTPEEFAAEAKGFNRDRVGQGTSNADPLPHTPIPATQDQWGEQKPEKVSLSLD